MSPEDLHTHGTPKTELIVVLGTRSRVRPWVSCTPIEPRVLPRSRPLCRTRYRVRLLRRAGRWPGATNPEGQW